jgi:hypothetical protein
MVQRMMLAHVVLILGTMGAVVLGGNGFSTDANAPQTLSEYLRYGALHSAGLKAAFEEWKAALEQTPQAKALPDPRLTYGYFTQEVETRVGPQLQRVSYRAGVLQARAAARRAAYEKEDLGNKNSRGQGPTCLVRV